MHYSLETTIMKRSYLTHIFLFLMAALGSNGAFSQAPAGYYASLEGKSGTALWNAVKTVAKKNHHAISYGTDTWTAFQKTDVRMVNGQNCWWDMYSNNNVPANSKPSSMNIEHSVANSWWGGTKNDAYKDIVHLNPSDATANSRKSNYPLGKIGTPTWDNGVTFIGKPASGYGGGNTYVYEPHDDYKGDFARVFMYMFVVYDDISWKSTTNWMYDTASDLLFKPWAYNMLLQWSAQDPVSSKEINRNNGIAATQGNRNPFIDLPNLADYIWGVKKGEPYHYDGSGTTDPTDPEDPIDPTDPTDPEDPEDPQPMAGTYTLVTSNSQIADGDTYLILADGSDVAMTVENKGKYFTHTEISVSNNTITALPNDAALVTLVASGGKYNLKVRSIDGSSQGYILAAGAKNVQLAETAGTGATINVAGGVTTVNYGSAGSLQYNASAPRFTTYTSGQKDLRFFRFNPEESAITEIENGADDSDDSFLVEVWGRNILAPEGASIFDLQGRPTDGLGVDAGVYIVVKPTFRKAVKVIVR